MHAAAWAEPKRAGEDLSAVAAKVARHDGVLATYAAQQRALNDKVSDLLDITLRAYVIPISESAKSHPALLQENMAEHYGCVQSLTCTHTVLTDAIRQHKQLQTLRGDRSALSGRPM